MTKKLSININQPCKEDWRQLQPTSEGGFCQSCQKNVIDFREMSDQEIFNYFQEAQGRTCGTFLSTQLKSYQPQVVQQNIPWLRSLRVATVSLMLNLTNSLLPAQSLDSQNQYAIMSEVQSEKAFKENQRITISGYVKDSDGGPIPGATIYLKGSITGTVSDIDGYYEFPGSLDQGDTLVFSFIGYQTREYIITEQTNEGLDVALSYNPVMGVSLCVMMGEVQTDIVYHQPKRFFALWKGIKSLFSSK